MNNQRNTRKEKFKLNKSFPYKGMTGRGINPLGTWVIYDEGRKEVLARYRNKYAAISDLSKFKKNYYTNKLSIKHFSELDEDEK